MIENLICAVCGKPCVPVSPPGDFIKIHSVHELSYTTEDLIVCENCIVQNGPVASAKINEIDTTYAVAWLDRKKPCPENTTRRLALYIAKIRANTLKEVGEIGIGVGKLFNEQKNKVEIERKEMLDALEDLVMACRLPGDHCEVEQALLRADAVLEKHKVK